MTSWERCTIYGSLCWKNCVVWLVFALLSAVGVAADEIDSIRAMPTSVARVEPQDYSSEVAANYSCYGGEVCSDTGMVVPARISPTNTGGLYGNVLAPGATSMGTPCQCEPWTWQVLPQGLLYHSFLANNREPRFGFWWVHEKDLGWLWDVALGGRMGLLRYGTTDALRPEGWELDIEGAAFPRLWLDDQRDMISSDFRF
ncbi:MAG: hypothetical protein U9N87_14175, partial [Planctomycetota bacterium]|nr:hypothetical protein [Planctomycetota bacterium]